MKSSTRELQLGLLCRASASALVVAVVLFANAAAAQTSVNSVPGCTGAWSSGACWLNFFNVPPDAAPSPVPPKNGQLVFIVPQSVITLDVDAQQARLDVTGTLTQPSNNLTINGVLTISANPISSGTFSLSGGTLNVSSPADAVSVGIGSVLNIDGGTLNTSQAIALSRLVVPGTPVDSTGTINMRSGEINAGGLIIGNGQVITAITGTTVVLGPNNGAYVQSGGTANFSAPVVVGGPLDPAGLGAGPGTGTIQISGGEFNVASTVGFGLVLGGTGTASLTQTDGTVNITSGPTSGGLELGRSAGGSGTYQISGGELNVNRESVAGTGAFVLVGNAGSGTFTQSGGSSVSVEGTITLGFAAGGIGNYTLSDSGTTLETEHLVIRTGTFAQTGGLVKIDTGSAGPAGGSLSIFSGGAYNLSAGATNDSRLDVEFTEIIQGGIFSHSGGTNIVDGPLTIGNGGQYFLGGIGSKLTVGDDATVTNASFTQTGGSAQINGMLTLDGSGAGIGSYSLGGLSNLAVAAGIVVGDAGLGSFTQTAGTASIAGGTLTLGHSATGSGTYTLSGTGVLAAGGDVMVGDAGTGTFNQNGGNVNIAGTLTLGAQGGGQGTWKLAGGELHVATEAVGAGGSGSFIQTSGLHTVAGNLTLAATTGSTATYALSDGTLQVAGNLRVASVPGFTFGGATTFNQSGGINQVSGALLVGAGGGVYALSGGILQAANEVIGAGGTGTAVFNQSGGVNTLSNVLTIARSPSAAGIYNLSGGIINAGDLSNKTIPGLVNDGTLNITNSSRINANVLNSATGLIAVTSGVLNVNGVITNLGTITLDPSTMTVQGLNVGATGVMKAGAGDVLEVLGDFINESVQNTLWNTDAAELDFIGGGAHTFALAGHSGAGPANNFTWGVLALGSGDILNLIFGSGDALYVDMLEGLTFSGDLITDITGAGDLFLYYNAADNPGLTGDYFLTGGGRLIAFAGTAVTTPTVPEPSTPVLLLAALLAYALLRAARGVGCSCTKLQQRTHANARLRIAQRMA